MTHRVKFNRTVAGYQVTDINGDLVSAEEGVEFQVTEAQARSLLLASAVDVLDVPEPIPSVPPQTPVPCAPCKPGKADLVVEDDEEEYDELEDELIEEEDEVAE